MAIVQISQIQQRSGNLVDLPQLNEAEFGWASDTKQLFIGKTTPAENIQVLTSYSNIYFNQLTGAVGNLNITASSLSTGEVLAFDGTNWINAGGNAGGNINLGNVSNLTITGGAIGYVLQTDGTGNLSWVPKTTVTAFIENVTKASPVVVTTTQDNFFTNGSAVTITNTPGMTQLNGSAFVKVLTSNTFSLYSDAGLTTPINSTGYTAFPYSAVTQTYAGNSGILLANSAPFSTGESIEFVGSTFGGIQANTVYYILTNTSNVITVSLTPNGNTVGLIDATGTANVYATGGRVIASVGGGSSNSAAAGSNTAIQYNNNNLLGASSSLTYDFANSIFRVVGNANVSNLNATNLVVASVFTSNVATGTAPFVVTSTTQVANLNVATSGLATYATTANSVAGANVSGAVAYATTANSVAGANVTGAVGLATYATTANSVAGANVTGAVGLATYATTANSVAGANVSGAVAYATTANSVAGSNVSGAVGLATYATTANSVAGANVSGTVANATNASAVLNNVQSTGTYYPAFISSTSNGNYSHASNTVFYANFANGALYATTFVGNVSGNISGNIVVNGSNTDVLFNDQGNANAVSAFTFNKTTNLVTITGNLITTANANVGNLNASGTVGGTGVTLYGNVLTTGANTTTGNITGNWLLTTGSHLQSTYSDLGEYYAADAAYSPGTVLMFGGDQEVTIAEDNTTRVAGVVSTAPAYVMNSNILADNPVVIALQGRVPCKVKGSIRKGDMMISGGDGYAKASVSPATGTVIGKALADFEGIDGVIEIAVGRL
jgi:hypothetical protein